MYDVIGTPMRNRSAKCSKLRCDYLRSVLISVGKENQLDVSFVFFISLLIVAQHVSGNHVPIIRS